MRIDIREFRLGKWYIPKEIESIQKTTKEYHALGYFDIIEVAEPDENEVKHIHPWSDAYQASYRLHTSIQSEYFVQEIKAFTNISDDENMGFAEETIKAFWDKDSLILCMSMIHVSLDTPISTLISHVRKMFEGKEYLYYYSFDYSGIIIVAKNINIHDYLEMMFRINYNLEEKNKIVKDTYSFYGFQKQNISKYLEKSSGASAEEREELCRDYFDFKDTYKYEVATNISIRNYSEYIKFKDELGIFENNNGFVSEKYELPGRHDISIVNKEADFYWLLYVQNLLDKHSIKGKKAFYAYETFVKTKKIFNDDKNVGLQDEMTCEAYDKIGANLRVAYESFMETFLQEGCISYITPIREVCNSVLSILKNAFAEDFVLCMYQAFFEFMQYLVRKLNEKRGHEQTTILYDKEIEQSFSKFFDGLSSLVNSAMHTDRQFIQATSFSAIFYDVPPKIMAFYVSMIRLICDVMSVDDKYRYTFLIKPGFSDEINVKIISFQCKEPQDRILQISINECFLYHPAAVMRRIAHEIAHFKGDGLRNREIRKEKIMRSYIAVILNECLPKGMDNDECFENVLENLYSFLTNNHIYSCDKENYSYQLKNIHYVILDEMLFNRDVQTLLRSYIREELEIKRKIGKMSELQDVIINEQKKHAISIIDINNLENLSVTQSEYLGELIHEVLNHNMEELRWRSEDDKNIKNYGVLNGCTLGTYAKMLISLYSETYADVQMLQVLGISYEEYLEAFIKDEKLDVEKLDENIEDKSRIATITMLMQEDGQWKLRDQVPDELEKLHIKITDFIKNVNKKDNVYYRQNKLLKEYLEECLDASKKHYSKEVDAIAKVRKISKIIVEHQDVQDVYSTICQTLCDYRRYLEGLTWEIPQNKM